MRTRLRIMAGTVALIGLAASAILFPLVRTASASPPPSFSLSLLPLADGSSEPEISIDSHGTMGMVSLQWLIDPDPTAFGTHLWTGPFGSPPTEQGIVDNALQHPGKAIFGAADADVDIGSTGRLHITTQLFVVSPTFRNNQLGVSAITCPNPATPGFSISQCTAQIIDTPGTDRPWITSDGPHVYISYHDSADSTLIHMQRSDDDGFTWQHVGDPVVGQGGTTADATFNNMLGNLVADPLTHNVYAIYAAGETGVLKGRVYTRNRIIVSRSSDLGKSWTANAAFIAAPGTSLANVFPVLAVDRTNGNLYAVWSDGHSVSFTSSSDQGNTWSPAIAVSSAPATTAVLPWVAANNGTVDVVYYGTTASSSIDPGADWHVYFAQLNGSGFTQNQVNTAPNHYGAICTGGTACGLGARNLLDLFQVAIDPQNGKAAIIYTEDTLTTSNDPHNFACLQGQTPPCPLPQAVLAQQTY